MMRAYQENLGPLRKARDNKLLDTQPVVMGALATLGRLRCFRVYSLLTVGVEVGACVVGMWGSKLPEP